MPRIQINTTKPIQALENGGAVGAMELTIGEQIDYDDSIWNITEHDDKAALISFISTNGFSVNQSRLDDSIGTPDFLQALSLPLVEEPSFNFRPATSVKQVITRDFAVNVTGISSVTVSFDWEEIGTMEPDDTFQVYIDGQLVLDHSDDQSPATGSYSGVIDVSAIDELPILFVSDFGEGPIEEYIITNFQVS